MNLLRYFLKKDFSYLFFALASILTVFLMQIDLTFAASARKYENPPCYDITGSTQPVLVGGVNNGGIMDFDDSGIAPKYQACVRMKADKVTPDRLEGWVWNDNLGWVSLYCPGGVGAKNLDVNCGSISYGVTFGTSGTPADFTTVKLDGYAWGDNIGWISFRSGFHQMSPTPSGSNRGIIPTTPNAARYAWADSVGWLDFAGVRMPWEDLDPNDLDPDVLDHIQVCSENDSGCSCDLDGTCPKITNPDKAPYANDTDVYDIKIPFYYQGSPLLDTKVEECSSNSINMNTLSVGGKEFCGKIELVWEDDVDLDQTVAGAQTQQSPKFNVNNDGAVTKPLDYHLGVGGFQYDNAEILWGAKVRSKAPTSDQNMFEGMDNEKFYYSGDLNGYDGTKEQQNLLILREIRLLLFKYADGGGNPGECIYGKIEGTECKINNYVNGGGSVLGFRPIVSLNKLNQDNNGKIQNFISVNSPEEIVKFNFDPFKIGSSLDAKITSYIGLENSDVYILNFIDGQDPINEINDSSPQKENNDLSSFVNYFAQLFSDDPGKTITSDAGPYLYTLIEYIVSGQNIKYWGAKLPRVEAGLILNPVAKVQGNVYVTDFAQKASDVSLHSLGNISSNLRREAILRNVSKYLIGFNGNIASSDVTISDVNSISGLTELVSGKVYYLKNADLTFNCSGGCKFNSNVTFIVENGNIYVNSDIIPNGNNQVGLIALRDLNGNVQNQGFLYLYKDVTWLKNTHIYLDRVMQSYDGTSSNTDGLMSYNYNDYGRQNTFKNQLVIQGTISSMNGIGNASNTPATDENGVPISDSSFCSNYSSLNGTICRARVVDLNYLRYYGPSLEICDGSEYGGSVAGVPVDQALKSSGNYCNPSDPSYSIDASNLYENDSNTDLISGTSGGKRSQYFVENNKPVTLENEFPVNFFYVPIAKDLAGFEVDQNFNPLIQN